MEEAGRVRRGYFVDGLGGAQFAVPGADDVLRRTPDPEEAPVVLSAVDPANAYGAILKWPTAASQSNQPQRTAAAVVILHRGELIGYVGRSGQHVLTFPRQDPAEDGACQESLADALAQMAAEGQLKLIDRVNGSPTDASPLANLLKTRGFAPTHSGYLFRRPTET